VGEDCLEGKFIKWNSNNGYTDLSLPDSEKLQVVSHFTFVRSKGKHLVVDLQGVYYDRAPYLTDPQVLSRDQFKSQVFGRGDLGMDGIREFFANHRCGPTCERLQLTAKVEGLLREI
jgi:hypothetical protein